MASLGLGAWGVGGSTDISGKLVVLVGKKSLVLFLLTLDTLLDALLIDILLCSEALVLLFREELLADELLTLTVLFGRLSPLTKSLLATQLVLKWLAKLLILSLLFRRLIGGLRGNPLLQTLGVVAGLQEVAKLKLPQAGLGGWRGHLATQRR